jgi:hypothetical protein
LSDFQSGERNVLGKAVMASSYTWKSRCLKAIQEWKAIASLGNEEEIVIICELSRWLMTEACMHEWMPVSHSGEWWINTYSGKLHSDLPLGTLILCRSKDWIEILPIPLKIFWFYDGMIWMTAITSIHMMRIWNHVEFPLSEMFRSVSDLDLLDFREFPTYNEIFKR